MTRHLENPYPGPLGSPLGWHDVSNGVAQIADRSGFRVRRKPGWHIWQVWGTDADIAALKEQEIVR